MEGDVLRVENRNDPNMLGGSIRFTCTRNTYDDSSQPLPPHSRTYVRLIDSDSLTSAIDIRESERNIVGSDDWHSKRRSLS